MKPTLSNPASASVWDRLTSPEAHSARGSSAPEQLKRAITRDLEALLNTRVAIPEAELAAMPHVRNSIANFGLTDFAQLCLAGSDDRKTICDRLQAAIVRHEPRLSHVRVHLTGEPGVVNRLSFVVAAELRSCSSGERIRLDISLEPSSLHYHIT